MLIKVLGAAAGGGYPQWNCQCKTCQPVWATPRLANTQSSIAFTADGKDWYLGNASPDIRQQILATPALHPSVNNLRNSPIKGIFLTNADLDHLLGTLLLREDTPWSFFATPLVLYWISQNPIFSVLNSKYVEQIPIYFDKHIILNDSLQIKIFPVPGKLPLYLANHAASSENLEHTIGLQIQDIKRNKRLVYIPGCGVITEDIISIISESDALFFDGTLWHDQELIAQAGRAKTAQNIAHVPITGDQGSLNRLSFFKKPKYYIHINNTNPIWLIDSCERKQVEDAGWQVVHDGMEICL